MASIARIRRKRRKLEKDLPGRLGRVGITLLSAILLAILSAGFLLGLLYTQAFDDLPTAESLTEIYGDSLDRFPPVTEVYDRTGERRLFNLLHPNAVGREWVYLGRELTGGMPDFVNAFIATQDPSFWTHDGFNLWDLVGSLFQSGSSVRKSIPQRLAEIVLPAEDLHRHSISQQLRSAALAQSMNAAYSKEKILELYLNSVQFGHLAPGIDAAALQYFGLHAVDLDLDQSATLVALAENLEVDPFDDAELKAAQGFVLASMAHSGFISEATFRETLSAPLPPRDNGMGDFAGIKISIARELGSTLGPRAIILPGLKIQSTLEADLQELVECTVQTTLDTEEGGAASIQEPGECEYAGDGETGDNLAKSSDSTAVLILDPIRGEILGLYGDVFAVRNPEANIDPFVYLAAFSRGNAPGSMILDLPLVTDSSELGLGAEAHGPVRMRTAMLGGYSYAFERIIQTVGVQAIGEVLGQMSLETPYTALQARREPEMRKGSSPLEMAFAYGVIANNGVMTGRLSGSALEPILIHSVIAPSGAEIYNGLRESKSVLSPPLAYLLIDVLSDSTSRAQLFNTPNLFELDQPIGVMADLDLFNGGNLSTIGFTPTRVVGVWLGNGVGGELEDADLSSKSIDLWNALMQGALREFPLSHWEIPQGVTFVEVCDPSGQLPTVDCPSRVTEVYLSGSEPTHLDQLYRSLRINRETGKLATVYTPLRLVEKHTFFIPPIEALSWAKANQILLPPTEFDEVEEGSDPADVWIDSPRFFSHVRGQVGIRGGMNLGSIQEYRLEVGSGLYPDRWYLIVESGDPVDQGVLGRWDSGGFDGLMTFQLLGIDGDGRVVSAFRSVSVDNQAPTVNELRATREGEDLEVFVNAVDNIEISRVDVYLQGRAAASLDHAPYTLTLNWPTDENAEIFVRVYDRAGNRTESETLVVEDE